MENKITDDLKNLNNLDKESVKVLTDVFTESQRGLMKDGNLIFDLYLKGKIYNLEKDKIHDKFKEYNYSFSKLNNSLNGEYCLVILKYEESKLRHVYISVDYSGVNSVYYFLKKNNVYNCHDKLYVLTKGKCDTLTELAQDKVLIEGGEQREIKIEDNVIKAEMFMIYKPDINLKAFLNPTVYGESGSVEEIKQKAKIWDSMHSGDNIVNSNYGWQWNRNNQLEKIIDKLYVNKDSRQAFITIYDGKEIDQYSFDTPCTLNIGFNRVLGVEKLTTDSPRVGPIERGLGGISAASMFAPGVSQTAGAAHNIIGSSPTLQKVDRKIGKEHEKAYKANPQGYTQMLGRSF